jgi:hypothetical protein
MPHGGEQERDLLLVVAHRCRLAHDLRHENDVGARVAHPQGLRDRATADRPSTNRKTRAIPGHLPIGSPSTGTPFTRGHCQRSRRSGKPRTQASCTTPVQARTSSRRKRDEPQTQKRRAQGPAFFGSVKKAYSAAASSFFAAFFLAGAFFFGAGFSEASASSSAISSSLVTVLSVTSMTVIR